MSALATCVLIERGGLLFDRPVVAAVPYESEHWKGRLPAPEEQRNPRAHSTGELWVHEDELGADSRVRVIVDGVRRRRHPASHRQAPTAARSLERRLPRAYGTSSLACTTACVARPLFVTGQTYQR